MEASSKLVEVGGLSILRVFIAVDIEDPLIISRLDRVKDALVSTGVPMKVVESYNMHLTLRFIGEVSRGVVDSISRALSRLEFKEFTIVFRGLGAFPNSLNPRVVWVGVGEGADKLIMLRGSVEKLLKPLSIPPEREEFTPHLTLARIKGSRGISSLVKLLNEYSEFEFGAVRVNSVRLKKSTLTSKGPIYETLLEVKAL